MYPSNLWAKNHADRNPYLDIYLGKLEIEAVILHYVL